MGKGLLMSVLLATVAIPIRAARDPVPARGLRRAALQFAAFVVVWAYALIHLFPLLEK
jgi:hypothetical protein